MAPYLAPRPVDRAIPLLVRSGIVRRAVISRPSSRLRRVLLARIFGWGYGAFNATGQFPDPVFLPDVETEQTGALIDTAGTFRGHDGLRRVVAELRDAFGEVRFEPERFAELPDDRWLFLVRVHAAGSASGVSIERVLGHLFELGDAGVARLTVYWEESDALEAAGIA